MTTSRSIEAYLTISRFSGDADQLLALYHENSDVMSGVGRDHGLILHAGAKTASGFLIVNLWPSQENSEAAARDPRRLGVIEHAGIDPDQIRREHHQVEHLLVLASAENSQTDGSVTPPAPPPAPQPPGTRRSPRSLRHTR
jgi:hypothetical protein